MAKTLADAIRDMTEARTGIEKLVKAMPRAAGVIAVSFIHKNFENQSYDDGFTKTPWAPRKEATDKAYDKRYGVKGSVYSSANPLLRQTGNLYDGIQHRESGNTTFVGVNLDKVPYAQAHNEGENHEPQRKFMPKPGDPPHPGIMKQVEKKYAFESDKIMSKFKK